MKTKSRLLILSIFPVFFVCLAFVRAESVLPSAELTIEKTILADVNRLTVVIIPHHSEYDRGGHIWSGLRETICNKLHKAGVKITAGVSGNVLEIPELRFYIDVLKLGDSQQYVFRVQTSLAEKVIVKETSKLCIRAEVFKTNSIMREVSAQDMPSTIADAVNKQVDAFIAIWSDKHSVNVLYERDAQLKTAVKDEKADKKPEAQAKFVASKNGKVFHKPDCQFVARISAENLISYDSKEEAIGSGKRPCKRCNP